MRRPPFASPPAPHASAHERECPDCGLLQCLPVLPVNGQACCLRCEATLRRSRPGALTRATALTVTSLVLYLVAVGEPFIDVSILGRLRETTMLSLPAAFAEEGNLILAVIVTATAILAPLAKIMVMLTVLLGIRLEAPPRFLPVLFKWYHRVSPWAMIEVFILGVFVAYTRLGAIATVEVGNALYAVAALMLAMVAADYFLDADEVWERMEARGLVPPESADRRAGPRVGCPSCHRVNRGGDGAVCTRCRTRIRVRKPGSVANTWALLAASVLLYVPANIFPILTVERLGRGMPSTILGGAQELLEAGMWPLALLVFVASITVPLLKLVSLAWMLTATQRGSSWRLHDRTRLFRLVDFIGRWSMIDVFMLATLVGLVRADALAQITPGVGATCFACVVVLTMIAVACFDPRLMWDAAERGPVAMTLPAEPDRPARDPAPATPA